MNLEEIRTYCLKKPGVTESLPFDENTLVFKVMGKIFALLALETAETRINLKCDPEKAQQLREQFTGVLPGYHMNKKHWNTVVLDGSFAATDLIQWIDDSYSLVVSGLSKTLRTQLKSES
jgi:predicted DNA-binding protein (MmcQ/YjbR family)